MLLGGNAVDLVSGSSLALVPDHRRSVPHVRARTAMWRHRLESHDPVCGLGRGSTARHARWTSGGGRTASSVVHTNWTAGLTSEDVAAVCRYQADQTGLAVKVELTWLAGSRCPLPRSEQLEEICNQVRNPTCTDPAL